MYPVVYSITTAISDCKLVTDSAVAAKAFIDLLTLQITPSMFIGTMRALDTSTDAAYQLATHLVVACLGHPL